MYPILKFFTQFAILSLNSILVHLSQKPRTGIVCIKDKLWFTYQTRPSFSTIESWYWYRNK
ncbi:hypothetical protein BpHYR1_003532 [Brachionus plicatilis]|uniref:Uncharacterized protein n=1 Tax=Brachionus plicatilis TaxID=10195 RepID=A0A3M7RV92_BRAPC|nr:hypothetical protein BpHYR1_003532 [Brachionus plicatilis]